MATNAMARDLATLGRVSVNRLRERYAEVYGESTPGRNKAWLVKRIAWRIQALAEGGLCERASARAALLANDADLRLNPPPRTVPPDPEPDRVLPFSSDARLPVAGTLLTRLYKGRQIQVQVLVQGFEYEGAVYTSLSAVATAITGSHLNGYRFFRLDVSPPKTKRGDS